jgi:DNA-binding MarR family transcriptional regulator
MDFFAALIRYEVRLWALVDNALREQGLVSAATLQTLEVVDHYGENARVQDLSGDIGITVGAASKVVDRLERDGLVARRPNPGDRRSSLISLTPEGSTAFRAAVAARETVLEAVLDPSAAAQALAALETLTAGLQHPNSELAVVEDAVRS